MMGLLLVLAAAFAPGEMPPHPLEWDRVRQDYVGHEGSTTAEIHFHFRNTSQVRVEIREVIPSCGCTVVTLPRQPWPIQPGQAGEIVANVDLRGKYGTLEKTLKVQLTRSTDVLTIGLHLPDVPPDPLHANEDQRESNRALAKTNRQAVFLESCAACHSSPLAGKSGAALYEAACEICHAPGPGRRASMVPDLAGVRGDRDFWRKWIIGGKADSLMPAFAHDQGGPLDPTQVESLVDLLAR